MRIFRINSESAYLADAQALWQDNKSTLGFFPQGAFEEHAGRGWLLGAAAPDGKLLGYLLYRVSTRASVWPVGIIVHLCVGSEARHTGVAKALVQHLRSITQDSFLRLELKCRIDFAANSIWPSLGFVYVSESPGKSGLPLARWQITFREPPLLAYLGRRAPHRQLRAVIDANVFFRLQGPSTLPSSLGVSLAQEAKALLEDWLADDLDLIVTDELFNEIAKNRSPVERARSLAYANRFVRLQTDLNRLQNVEQQVASHFPRPAQGSLLSDIKQLAHAIAAGEQFFLSQDNGLLKKSNRLAEQFAVHVLSPGQFIARIDELARATEYMPSRIAGAHALTTARLSQADVTRMFEDFRSTEGAERRGAFESSLRALLSRPKQWQTNVYRRVSPPSALVLMATGHPSPLETTIPLLRVSKHPIAPTVLRHVLRRTVPSDIRDQIAITRITDGATQAEVSIAAEESGFTLVEGTWVKCNLPLASPAEAASRLLKDLAEKHPSLGDLFTGLAKALEVAMARGDPASLIDVERRLWPLKILDAPIPTFIVPIKPTWAHDLFDERMAAQTLWGAAERVALLNENVYYRAATSPWPITAPSRIMWYVSKQEGYEGAMSIRACSYLDEVLEGPAKTLYRSFKRLGIYSWEDVRKAAKGDPNGVIMALRFSNTELLPRPVPLANVRRAFDEHEPKHLILQSPQPISAATFAAIYSLGTTLNNTDRQ